MSNSDRRSPDPAEKLSEPDDRDEDGEDEHGPNLKLLYGLIALALVAAIAIAATIVLPFYRNR